jgi:hypothetical protein
MTLVYKLKYHIARIAGRDRRLLFISEGVREHMSVFQRLIRPRVLALNLEIALKLSAESAQARESL